MSGPTRDVRDAGKLDIETDAAFARGVRLGLRAWHEDWSADEVSTLAARVERMNVAVQLARSALKSPTVGLAIVQEGAV